MGVSPPPKFGDVCGASLRARPLRKSPDSLEDHRGHGPPDLADYHTKCHVYADYHTTMSGSMSATHFQVVQVSAIPSSLLHACDEHAPSTP